MKNIEKIIPIGLWNVLAKRRQEAIDEEAKIKEYALDRFGASMAKENRATLVELYSTKFIVKQRVSTLMGRYKNEFEKLQKETTNKFSNIPLKYGMI